MKKRLIILSLIFTVLSSYECPFSGFSFCSLVENKNFSASSEPLFNNNLKNNTCLGLLKNFSRILKTENDHFLGIQTLFHSKSDHEKTSLLFVRDYTCPQSRNTIPVFVERSEISHTNTYGFYFNAYSTTQVGVSYPNKIVYQDHTILLHEFCENYNSSDSSCKLKAPHYFFHIAMQLDIPSERVFFIREFIDQHEMRHIKTGDTLFCCEKYKKCSLKKTLSHALPAALFSGMYLHLLKKIKAKNIPLIILSQLAAIFCLHKTVGQIPTLDFDDSYSQTLEFRADNISYKTRETLQGGIDFFRINQAVFAEQCATGIIRIVPFLNYHTLVDIIYKNSKFFYYLMYGKNCSHPSYEERIEKLQEYIKDLKNKETYNLSNEPITFTLIDTTNENVLKRIYI